MRILLFLFLQAMLWSALLPLFATDEGFRLPPLPAEALVYPAGEVVPLQALGPLLGCGATRDLQSGLVTVTRQGRTFACAPFSTAAESNGKAVTLPLAPVQRKKVLYLPLRPLVEALGGTVQHAAGMRQSMLTVTLPGLAQPFILPVRPMTDSPATLNDTAANLYLMNSDGSALRRLTYNTVDTGVPVLSPDGNRWAYTYDGGLYVRLAGIGTPVCLSASRSEAGYRIICRRPIFSKDSARLYYMDERTNGMNWSGGTPAYLVDICRSEIVGGEKTILAKGNDLCASRDGAIFAFSDADGQLHVIDATGKLLVSFQGRNPVISPDGARLVYAANDAGHPSEKVYQLSGAGAGTVQEAAELSHPPLTSACFSPDGSAFFYLDRFQWNVVARMANANLKSPHDLTGTEGMNVIDPQFSPDGTQVFANNQNYNCCLYSVKTDGTRFQRLTHNLKIAEYAISPDGKQILFAASSSEF